VHDSERLIATPVLVIGTGGAGLRAAMDPQGTWQQHAADTLYVIHADAIILATELMREVSATGKLVE
jgi:hypothetical protein